MNNDKNTRELMNVLVNIDNVSGLEKYLEEENMNDFGGFAEYLNSLEKVRNRKMADIIRNAGLDRNYGYELLRLTPAAKKGGQDEEAEKKEKRKRATRDRLIAICIGAELDIDETQRALEAAKTAPLYSRDRRDAVIIFGINHHKNIIDINLLLDEQGFDTLETVKPASAE